MLIVIGRATAAEGKHDELRVLTEAKQNEFRQVPGCLSYGFSTAVEDPEQFVSVGLWESKEALEAHIGGPGMAGFGIALVDLVAGAPIIDIHHIEGTTQFPDLDGVGEGKLIVIGRVGVAEGKHDELRALMETMQTASRQEPGCADYGFFVAIEDPDQFVAVELWESKEALQTHFEAPSVANFGAGLGGLIAGAPSVEIHQVEKTARFPDIG